MRLSGIDLGEQRPVEGELGHVGSAAAAGPALGGRAVVLKSATSTSRSSTASRSIWPETMTAPAAVSTRPAIGRLRPRALAEQRLEVVDGRARARASADERFAQRPRAGAARAP